ncbi:60S ribosomal protein L31 [Cichlidogyrus casuarinus]|uniref:Large ribosomal subunit protein eL31 n=1 Tax=Cichlidogyrus casuarinus TaxID=1844966 RepID=A0ABD2PXW8_9PLAT
MVKNKPKTKRTRREGVCTREYTVNLHKRLHGLGFKRKAPRAVRELKKFAQKNMGTDDVRIGVSLNKYIWSKGIRNVPYRVRVRLARRLSEDEESEGKYYTLVTYVPCADFKGKHTMNVEDDE